jgi:Methyltransferase domain
VPAVDYDRHGRTYSEHRRTDPRIAARIHAALGDARTVLNVGAGTGSYEPEDRWVLAVEPSATMRAQRPAGAAPAVIAKAEQLPLDDDAVDAAMACFTVHHWQSPRQGLAELQRVARRRVIVSTLALDQMPAWQRDYLGEALAVERSGFPTVDAVAARLPGRVRVECIATPADCTDGFIEAFWNRPEALLDPRVRAAQSLWRRVDTATEERIVARLGAALASGEWDAEHGALREQVSFDGSLRLVIAELGVKD